MLLFESLKLSDALSRGSRKLTEENFKEYNSNNDDPVLFLERLPEHKKLVLVKSTDSLNKESLSYSLTQSGSAKMSLNPRGGESPEECNHPEYFTKSLKRSKTPTMQSSTCHLMNSIDLEKNHFDAVKNSAVRETPTIKNPFLAFNDEHARISTLQGPQMETYQSLKAPLGRCETEAKLNKHLQKYTHFFSEC